MKKYILLLLLATGFVNAQSPFPDGIRLGKGLIPYATGTYANKTGIGTLAPASALDVVSTTGGITFPRLTTTQRNATSGQPVSTVIWNITNTRYEYFDGSVWQPLVEGGFTSLQQMWDDDTANLVVTDGDDTFELTPSLINFINSDGSFYGVNAEGFSAENSVGAKLKIKVDNLTENYNVQLPNLPVSGGEYTPVFSATLNGGAKILADVEGNIDLGTISGDGVPYTGATADVDLGDHTLTMGDGTASSVHTKSDLQFTNTNGAFYGIVTNEAVTSIEVSVVNPYGNTFSAFTDGPNDLANVKVHSTYQTEANLTATATNAEVTLVSNTPNSARIIENNDFSIGHGNYTAGETTTLEWPDPSGAAFVQTLQARNGTVANVDQIPAIDAVPTDGSLNAAGSNGTFDELAKKAAGAAASTDNAIARFDGTTGKIIQNSGASIDDNGGLTLAAQASPTHSPGTMVYDSTNDCFTAFNSDSNVSLQIGQEQWIRVRNVTGSTIPNGSAVYINGTSANVPTIALAQANSGTTTVVAGLTTEAIANNAFGFVTSLGLVRTLNTSAFTTGAVYLSETTPGGLTQTIPVAPNFRMRVGFVTNVNASTGSIHVTPSTAVLGNGTQGQVLSINSAGSQVWKSAKSEMTPNAAFNYAITANTLTKAFNVGASGNGSLQAQTRTYFFDGFISLSGVGTMGSVSFGFLGTATISGIRYTSLATKSATPSTALSGDVTTASATALTTSTATANAILRITGTVRISGAGSLIPAITSSANQATATTNANSWFVFEDLGPNNITATPDID